MRNAHAGDGKLRRVVLQGLEHDMVRFAAAVGQRQDGRPVQLPQTAPRAALHQACVACVLRHLAAVRDRFVELESPDPEQDLECGREFGQFAGKQQLFVQCRLLYGLGLGLRLCGWIRFRCRRLGFDDSCRHALRGNDGACRCRGWRLTAFAEQRPQAGGDNGDGYCADGRYCPAQQRRRVRYALDFCSCSEDQAPVDPPRFLAVRAQQGAIANNVDQPRNAVGQPVDFALGGTVEHFTERAGDPQAVLDILCGLVTRQGLEMVAAGYALRQLPQIFPRKQVPKFGLPDQDNLQQFLFRGLQVGQQPHLFEHVAGQVLRLVDDEDDAASFGMSSEQLPVKGIHQRLDAAPHVRGKDPEFLANGFEKLDDREARVQYNGDVGIVRQLVLQQAAALGHAIDEMRERLAVALAHEQVTRVGRYREWLFIESEETRVHD